MKFGLDFIRLLRPSSWRYKPPLDDGRRHFGVMAQEVDVIAPHNKYGFVNYNKERDLYTMQMIEFVGPLIKAVQELDEKITRLENAAKTRSD